MAPNLMLQINDLENALHRYSLLELSIADATKLRQAFMAFKDRLFNRILSQEENTHRQSDLPDVLHDLAAPVLESNKLTERTENETSSQKRIKSQILLAEHDTKVAAFFIKYLHGAGYNVLWASHASMAITLIQNGNPDAILCSVYSSKSFGREVLTFTRDRAALQTPVLLVGGANHSEALRDAIHLGADDYMAQHITAAEVVGKIERLLR